VDHSTSVTDTHRVLNAGTGGNAGIEEVGAEWFGQQLGRGEEGLVAKARSQRMGEAGQARAAGKTAASSKTSQKAMALREQIREVVVQRITEAQQRGLGAHTALQSLSARRMGNELGTSAATIKRHLLAMACSCDPELKAQGEALSVEAAAKAVLLFEAKRMGRKAA
jgi:hypothetical protein